MTRSRQRPIPFTRSTVDVIGGASAPVARATIAFNRPSTCISTPRPSRLGLRTSRSISDLIAGIASERASAGNSDDAVLEVGVSLHPSARTVRFETPSHELLIAEIADLADAPAVLIVRPFEQVLLSHFNAVQMGAIGHASAPTSICNLIARLGEQDTEARLLPTLIAFIETGALIRISGESK